jgi:2-methylcitrate dehydratase PrpD
MSAVAATKIDMNNSVTDSIASAPTRELARFAAALQYEAIPPALIERIKLHILDGVGVCLHGAALPWTKMVADMAVAEGGNGTAALWANGARTSVSQAVLVNCTAGHAFEMDDIHKESVLHPNSLAVPVALALAGAHPGLSGRDVLTAIIAGYEVGTRVGNAATTALFLNGFHPQGTSGAFVAAATAGRLLGLSAEAMQNALGIAGSMGAGLMAAQEGAMVKRLHAGRAAQSGVYGAMLAQRGFTGISNILEAEYGGFLSSFARDYKIEKLTAALGEDWEAGKVGFKMYPNVTSIHAALDALHTLLTEHSLKAGDIAKIEVGCGHMTYVHTAWEYKPAGVTAAQMNLYYGLAVMALRGSVSAADYTEARIADPDVLAFMARIQPFEDATIEAKGAPFRHAATIKLHTVSGKVLSHDIWGRRGSPENPVSYEEVEAKFFGNVAGVVTPANAKRIAVLVKNLDSSASLEELNALL